MADRKMEEFEALREYCIELNRSLKRQSFLRPERLLKIRDHINRCDHIISEDENGKREISWGLEKTLLFFAENYWERCRKRWLAYRPKDDEDIVIPELQLKTKKVRGKQTILQSSQALRKKPEEKKNELKESEYLTSKDIRFLKIAEITSDFAPAKPEERKREELTSSDVKFLRSLRIAPITDEDGDKTK